MTSYENSHHNSSGSFYAEVIGRFNGNIIWIFHPTEVPPEFSSSVAPEVHPEYSSWFWTLSYCSRNTPGILSKQSSSFFVDLTRKSSKILLKPCLHILYKIAIIVSAAIIFFKIFRKFSPNHSSTFYSVPKKKSRINLRKALFKSHVGNYQGFL